MKVTVSASALALSLIAGAASAQAVRTEKNMSLELANQIAAATVAACAANNYNVTAAVVDAQGRVVPTANVPLSFSLAGPGRIIGVGNGDPTSHEPDVFVGSLSTRARPIDGWRWKKIADPYADTIAEAAPGLDVSDGSTWKAADVRRPSGPLGPNERGLFRATFTVTAADLVTPKVTTGPLAASRKVYASPDSAPDLRVPIREIALHESSGEPPLPVYDTTGPYTDPNVVIDVEKGLARPRIAWVKERGGVEEYDGRPIQPVDNGNATGKYLARNFPNTPKPFRAVADAPRLEADRGRIHRGHVAEPSAHDAHSELNVPIAIARVCVAARQSNERESDREWSPASKHPLRH